MVQPRTAGALLACATGLVMVGCAGGRPSATGDVLVRTGASGSIASGTNAPSAPPCQSSVTGITFEHAQGAGGTEYGFFRIRNGTTQACSLFGLPQLQLLDGRGAVINAQVKAGPPSAAQRNRDLVPEPVTLTPGAEGGFDLLWVFPALGSRCPGPGVIPDRLAIRLPGSENRVVLSAQPLDGARGIDACKGVIYVTPVYGPPMG